MAETNASGAVTWREQYTPYGDTLLRPAANDNKPGFTGHIQDSQTGLTYMQARYYDPVIGRFLSVDPVGFSPDKPGMFNRYAYTLNDPINMTDPNGECPWCIVIGAVAGAVVNTAVYAATAENVTLGGLAANAIEGAIVGGVAASGIGLLGVPGVAADSNVAEGVATDAALGAETGQKEGIFASKNAGEVAANVAGDLAKGAISGGAGKVVGAPLGDKAASIAQTAGSALSKAGSKAVGPALKGAAPAVAAGTETLVGEAAANSTRSADNPHQHLKVPQLE